ncbi:exodeoxyribonuclease III [Oscillatoria sp. CS-180]|uniref:exodeoxyribonuclease III n=1 Tax=Oscillatoria sp. CS-180 TaxID=3021720 RepID=UPI00232B38C5|nr:exodeoxyribonuclease III [Oscillatoria sp. CS-180]MDB9525918.1 exodeoxyribonuclease III [Oscillatoria sp. CS-180]
MQIATWNVNSIRTRLAHVTDWLSENPVDVLCLQETKVVDQDFPLESIKEAGYVANVSGQKSYNGVAILSRAPLEDVRAGFTPVVGGDNVGDLDDQKRVLTGVLDGVRIVNLYVPNGSSIGSDKYDYKLRWLGVLKTYLETLLAENESLLVCGDFNVALEDRDIHDPKGKETHIMASPQEREALQAVLAIGLKDAFRKFHEDGGHFSWWDYRAASFRRNRGWRIDHHYLSPLLYSRATNCTIDVAPREREKPSDHAPVIVEI